MNKDNKKVEAEILEKRKARLSRRIDNAILVVKEEIKTSNDSRKISILTEIMHELNEMKRVMSPSVYFPSYGYVIVDSYQDFNSNVEETLLMVLQAYKSLEEFYG